MDDSDDDDSLSTCFLCRLLADDEDDEPLEDRVLRCFAAGLMLWLSDDSGDSSGGGMVACLFFRCLWLMAIRRMIGCRLNINCFL